MSQYALSLSLPPVFSEENFVVSGCNREAHGWIARWPDWPASALLLYGPAGSGKSHLGQIWAARAGARIVDAPLPGAGGNFLLENIERAGNERALLHSLNLARENKQWLLLTSSVAPRRLPFSLPDLTSRLLALPAAAIAPPDEALLAAALRKQFADRQLKVEEEVIAYLMTRMERSFAAAASIVEVLDKQALEQQRNITVPFAKRALSY